MIIISRLDGIAMLKIFREFKTAEMKKPLVVRGFVKNFDDNLQVHGLHRTAAAKKARVAS